MKRFLVRVLQNIFSKEFGPVAVWGVTFISAGGWNGWWTIAILTVCFIVDDFVRRWAKDAKSKRLLREAGVIDFKGNNIVRIFE